MNCNLKMVLNDSFNGLFDILETHMLEGPHVLPGATPCDAASYPNLVFMGGTKEALFLSFPLKRHLMPVGARTFFLIFSKAGLSGVVFLSHCLGF